MTGRIRTLAPSGNSGFIRTENGLDAYFDDCAVMAYDVSALAVGQVVTFDLTDDRSCRAINVFVERRRTDPTHPDTTPSALRLRYVGFEQSGSSRAYRFECRCPGEQTRILVVDTAQALFTRYGIKLQDGPALCLRVLAQEMIAGDPVRLPLHRSLTEQHMLAHVTGSPPRPSRQARRVPHSPVAASQIRIRPRQPGRTRAASQAL